MVMDQAVDKHKYVVVYSRVVVDKELGIYLDDIYVAGFCRARDEADEIAKKCTSAIRGGSAIVNTFDLSTKRIVDIITNIKRQYDKIERNMIDAELILEESQRIAKERRNRKKSRTSSPTQAGHM